MTGETTGEIVDLKPGGEHDLLTVFMPTGIVPPTGFICFVPRKDVQLLSMSAEEAAKVILSGGIVMPEPSAKLEGTRRPRFASLRSAGGSEGRKPPPRRLYAALNSRAASSHSKR